MTVIVNYRGYLGNNLFQYCYGRIIAERLNYALEVEPIDNFPGTEEEVGKIRTFSFPAVYALRGHETSPDLACLSFEEGIKNNTMSKDHTWYVNGWFQRYEHYQAHKEKIKKWLYLENSEFKPGLNDIVLHARYGDGVIGKGKNSGTGDQLNFNYYKEVIERAAPDKIYMVTDNKNHPDVQQLLNDYKIEFHQGNPIEDFKFIKTFNNICISRSTFSWWAAFLSNATKIYFPIPDKGHWSVTDEPHEDREGTIQTSNQDLRVYDEDRYVYVDVKIDHSFVW